MNEPSTLFKLSRECFVTKVLITAGLILLPVRQEQKLKITDGILN